MSCALEKRLIAVTLLFLLKISAESLSDFHEMWISSVVAE